MLKVLNRKAQLEQNGGSFSPVVQLLKPDTVPRMPTMMAGDVYDHFVLSSSFLHYVTCWMINK